jgi:pimeloyl-ACP methyl ester carboxylesterase
VAAHSAINTPYFAIRTGGSLFSGSTRNLNHSLLLQLPGYGVSTLPLPGHHTKRAAGATILEALTSVFDIPPRGNRNSSARKILLIGHDRGARIAHRLAVDEAGPPLLKITSLILMDILPTMVQWESFSNPRAGVAYFHWPFLANVDLATQMIDAYGGDKWCRDLLIRGQGSSVEGQTSFAANGAHDVYAANFAKRDAILGSCEDYRCGSAREAEEQADDMEQRLKINVPALVIFSEKNLDMMHDVAHVWQEWVAEGVPYQARGIGGGIGHYLPEEDPEQIGELVVQWVQTGSAIVRRAV